MPNRAKARPHATTTRESHEKAFGEMRKVIDDTDKRVERSQKLIEELGKKPAPRPTSS